MASSRLLPLSSSPSVDVPEDAPRRSLTTRAVVLCLALAVFFGYVIPIVDVKMSNTFMGAQHLPPSAVGVLIVLLLVVNPLMRLLSKKTTFSRGELLTVYISCLFSTLVPGHGGEGFFISQVIAPFYFATRENRWLQLWEQYVPKWMTPAYQADPGGAYGVRGHEVVEGWFNGLPPGGSIPWSAWFVPLVAWASLIFAMYGALACLSVMLRAQWGDREALAFPLLRLPLEMTQDVDNADKHGILGRFWKNPVLWLGVGLAVCVQTVNGLHLYFPDVPAIPLSLDMGPMLQESPWNQIGTVPIFIWPIVVGITFLLTSEVSFSLWFFYWFIKFQLLGAYFVGLSPATSPGALQAWGKAFTSYQRVGGYIAYVLLILWAGREHFKHIARRAFGKLKASDEEKTEAMSYPAAFWGFFGCSAFIIGWGYASGVRPDIALAFWVLSLIMLIGLTRLVVEGGILLMTPNWLPMGTLAQIFNSGPGTWLSPAAGIVPVNFMMSAMVGDPRAFSMPSFLQSFKLAHDHKIPARPLLALIFACISVTFAMSCWMRIRLGYENGGMALGSWFFAKFGSQFPAFFSNDLLNGVPGASWSNAGWMAVGAVFTYGLMIARSRLPWFPLHPIGFLLCLTWAMEQIWFSVFVGWSCKVLITRFGGNETYRKATPFFLGLALGDIIMILFWIAVDGWQGRMGHHLTPD